MKLLMSSLGLTDYSWEGLLESVTHRGLKIPVGGVGGVVDPGNEN